MNKYHANTTRHSLLAHGPCAVLCCAVGLALYVTNLATVVFWWHFVQLLELQSLVVTHTCMASTPSVKPSVKVAKRKQGRLLEPDPNNRSQRIT